jgi:arylsulfatase
MVADGDRPRDVAYAQYFGCESGAYSCRMIRDARFKFVYHPVGDMHEFYDLTVDPGELNNLIADPSVAADLARLKARLWDEMKSCGDPLGCKWTEIELKEKPNLARQCGIN